MRRSLAPSQILKQKDAPTIHSETKKEGASDSDGMVMIQRLPLFGFLEIPKDLSKQFKVPAGCILTEK